MLSVFGASFPDSWRLLRRRILARDPRYEAPRRAGLVPNNEDGSLPRRPLHDRELHDAAAAGHVQSWHRRQLPDDTDTDASNNNDCGSDKDLRVQTLQQ